MKKILAALLVFALTGCGGLTPVRAPSKTIDHMGKSTVGLMIYDEEDAEYRVFCTGVWVSQDKILTAKHCVEAAAKIAQHIDLEDEDAVVNAMDTRIQYVIEPEAYVGDAPAALHLSAVVSVDDKHDLALLVAAPAGMPPHHVAKLAEQMPALGEKILFVGHPRGLYWSYIEGVCAAYRQEMPGVSESKDGPFMQVSAPVFFGNSGGGAFDTDGNLLGIASFISRAPNTAFYVHKDSIKKFLALPLPVKK